MSYFEKCYAMLNRYFSQIDNFQREIYLIWKCDYYSTFYISRYSTI